MTFGPLRGRPDCCVHLGGVPLPLVQQYRYLGVVLSPTLSWRPRVDFICSRGDGLFYQASAWCLGEGLPLSFSSPVFVTYVLSSSSFGLEFICDGPSALHQFNLALRRWCGPALPLLLQCTGNLALVMLCTLDSAAHSRFSVGSALLTTPLLVLRLLPVFSDSLPLCKARGRTGSSCGALSIGALFQRWLSSHVPAMALRVTLVRPQCLSKATCVPAAVSRFLTRRCRGVCSLKGFRSHVPAVVLRVSWGLDVFRDVSGAMCQLRFSMSICASHLVGFRDMSKARYGPWISSL